jgi:hypothetical protein
MKQACEKLRSSIEKVAGKYTSAPKRKELDKILDILEKEISSQQITGQRIMPLLRLIMVKQPGTAKFVNEFLKDPHVARTMHHGGFTME